MAPKATEQRLFFPEKIKWMLGGGLQTMDAGERQMLLIMAETKLQGGYKPTPEEKQVIEQLRASAGEEYDAQDIKKKVHTMVKSSTKPGTAPLRLPPVFDRLKKRLLGEKKEE